MKTQIITLEPHDDLVSLRDKLSWVKTPRVLVVWSKQGRMPLRVLDLKVLQRQAASLGAQLGLVSRRAEVIRSAQSLGIPVFPSTTAAQRQAWPAPAERLHPAPRAPRRDLRRLRDLVREKEPSWRTSLAGRVVPFVIGVFAILTVAAVFLPRARVILHPHQETQSMVIPIAAGQVYTEVSLSGTMPARTVSVIVGDEQALAIVHEIDVPETKARGVARFTNRSQDELELPAGLVVASGSEPPVQYRTLHGTLLPPGTNEFVDVPIEALLPGSGGNAPVGSLAAVEGALGRLVAVTNPKLISGGTDRKIVGASETDRARLREVVMENMARQAREMLQAQISPGDLPLPDTFELVRTIEETYAPPPGQAGKTLTLTMQAGYALRYISEADLDHLARLALDSSPVPGYLPSGDPQAAPAADPVTDPSGLTRFDLRVSRSLLKDLDRTLVVLTAPGARPRETRADLMASLDLRQEPEIQIVPSWWPWMPLIPLNISVEMR